MDHDAQQLWEAFCATTDEPSFNALYDRFRSLAWTLCWRILGNEEDTHDAFQSAWARLFAHAREQGSAAAADSVMALIYRFSIREADALNKRRIRRRRREIVMDELPAVSSGAVPADEMAAAAERRTRLETIVAMLPEKYRLPIQLHYMHGMTQAQIAEMMDISQSAVATRLSRGTRKLTPLAERAGLGNLAGILGAVAAGGVLLSPPKALAGAVLYVQIESMLAAGATSAAIAAGGSAAVSKTIVGVTVMKMKLAVVSGLLAVAAATAIGIHYHNSGNKGVGAPGSVAQVTIVRPTPPSVVVVNSLRKTNDAGKPAAAKATPAPTPTPAATPEGPLREIRVAVVWGDTQNAATDTTVSMQNNSAGNNVFPTFGRTDSAGLAKVKIPEAWEIARIKTSNPNSLNMYQTFEPATVQQPIVIALTRAGRIFGSVRTTDGRPVAGADIGCQGNGAYRVTRSAEDGTYEVYQIPAGSASLTATYKNLRSDINGGARVVTAVVGERVGPIALTLEPGLTVTGVVTASKTGQPVPGATIMGPSTGNRSLKATSDLAGRFTLAGLTAARQTLRAKAPNYAIQARMVMPAADAETRCDFTLDPGGEVEATVVDEKGNPLEGAEVRAYFNSVSTVDDVAPRTDSSGRTTVRNVATDQSISLSASKTGLGSASQQIMFPPGELKTKARLTLKPEDRQGSYIAGTVTDETGKPLPDINIYSGYYQSSAYTNPTTKTDAQGRYELQTTASNSYYLSAYGKGWGTEAKRSVTPGTKDKPTRADFVMKPGHWLAGVVVDEKDSPLKDIQISLSSSSTGNPMPSPDLKTDASGRFRAEDLPDSRMNVNLSGKDIPSQSQTAGVDTETRFVLKAMGSIRGRVIDKDTQKPVQAFAIKVAGSGIDYQLNTTGQAFSNPDGKFEIKLLTKDDAYDLTIESKDYSSHTESQIVAKAADNTEEITINISKGAAIRGVLIDANSRTPIAGALVAYGSNQNSYFSWRYITDSSYSSNIQIVARAVTGADGRFELNADNEHLTMWIVPAEHKRMLLSEADRARFKSDKEYVIPIARGATLTGKVYLDGKIQPQNNIYINQLTAQSGQGVDFGQINTDEQGVYLLGGLDAGDYTISGPNRRVGNYGYYVYSKKVPLKDGEKKEVNLGDNLGGCLLAGAVLNGGQSVPNAHITLNPTFDWEYTGFSGNSDENGVYAIDGLAPGKYNANVYKYDDSSGMSRYQVNEVVEVKAGTTEHNFERGGHKVTGRLVFSEDAAPSYRSSFRNGHLSIMGNIQQPETGPKIDQYASCEIKAGVLTFDGRFKGDYHITIAGDYQSGNTTSMMLPQTYKIDNTQADVDLGEIAVPATGRIKVNIRNTDPNVRPRNLQAVVSQAGSGTDRRGVSNSIMIDPSKGEQSVGPVPVGDVEVRIVADGFRCEPKSAPVTVTAGQESGPLNFTVTPSSDIIVIVMTPNTNLQTSRTPIPGSKVTLTGNGVQRQLLASDAPVNEQTAMIAYSSNQDVTFGPAFIFRNLPEGSYTLAIEAPGYKPYSQQTSAAKGKTAQIQARLQKLQ
ncbi:sigma-70 family RNA polymerase sigma factor [bacterium]|nr:sigma-70 family RNA polymerase sigma factor [bacterium]